MGYHATKPGRLCEQTIAALHSTIAPMNGLAATRCTLRIVGAVTALFGATLVVLGCVFFLPASLKDGNGFLIAFGALPIFVGAAFIWLGSAACLSLSPKSARELLGLLAMLAAGAMARQLSDLIEGDVAGTKALAFLGITLAVYAVYRASVSWVCRRLFPVHLSPPSLPAE